MTEVLSNNRRIAKNSIFLYMRMVITMVISLYTSRVLLKNLGVDDFGIYGLVGGIVTMFASLKTLFTVATQRFINIEIGRNDAHELNKVFNVSILVNLVIAALFVIVVEIGGLWLLENKLQIAPERMNAAHWVFQFSVLASIVAIINIPYDSDIIAREKMNFFAIVSIFDSVAKLIIVLLLPVIGGDRLIVYGFLMLCVVSIDLGVNVAYCRTNFKESKFARFSFPDIREKFREMFTFSGWAFFGNIVFALVNEGINVLLNIFGNVAANAARTITYQVKNSLSSVVSNVYVAVKPQAIQSFARQEIDRFYKLMFTGAKLVGYMYILMAIPLFFTLNEVLTIWLGIVPEYAVAFLSASLLYQFVRVLHESVGTFFVTIGELKEYQMTEFFTLGSALPLAYVALKVFYMPLYGVFLVMAFSELGNLFAILHLAKKIGGFDVRRYVKTVLIPYVFISFLCFVSVWLLKRMFSFIPMGDIPKAILLIVTSIVAQLVCILFIGLHKEERDLFVNLIRKK